MKYVGFFFWSKKAMPKKNKKYKVTITLFGIQALNMSSKRRFWIFLGGDSKILTSIELLLIKTKISQPINTSISLAPCVLKSNIVSKRARS